MTREEKQKAIDALKISVPFRVLTQEEFKDYYQALSNIRDWLEQEPRCKECKWWKDSDGEYRRGCRAESKCPINRKEVFEGNGYCYLFKSQESEEE